MRLVQYFKKLDSYFPWRFFKKVGLLQLTILILTVLIGSAVSRIYLKEYIVEQSREQLAETIQLLSKSFESSELEPLSWCQTLRGDELSRFTLIGPQGKVSCDNFADITKMDNHLDRPEVKTAMQEGIGSNIRYSETLNLDMLYMAKSINISGDTYFIRQAIPISKLQSAMSFMDRALLFILIPVIFISFVMLFWGSLKVSTPMQSILEKVKVLERDVDELDSTDALKDDEWTLVENAIEKAANKISEFLVTLKNENKKINTLLYSMPDPVVALDSENKILFHNLAFKKYFTNNDSQSLRNKKIWEFVRDHDLQALFNDVVRIQEQRKVRNYKVQNNGQGELVYDGIISPLKNEKNEAYGAICIFHDVTLRYHSEKIRADFVSNISHEIKTPLTSLVGYTQIIEEDLQELNYQGDMLKYCNKITRNAKRLTELFQDVLNLSSIENVTDLAKERISTKEVTEYAISNIKQSYPNHKLKLEVNYHSDSVYAQGNLLEQVITNLVENAFKYVDEDGQVSINWDNRENLTTLTVENSGQPIGEEHRPRLFERFYRIDSSRSRNDHGGSGLGLSIVKHIAQKHGGSVGYIYNQENHRNSFYIQFPHS